MLTAWLQEAIFTSISTFIKAGAVLLHNERGSRRSNKKYVQAGLDRTAQPS
jgi:hypothetical protein